MRRKAVIVGTIVTLVVSGLLGLLWSQQRRLIYFPSGGPVPPAATVLPGARDVVLHTADGLELGLGGALGAPPPPDGRPIGCAAPRGY